MSAESAIQYHKRKGRLAPDPEMWQGLQQGQLLREILTDFYTQVYADPVLSPFFANVTINRIIDKQYMFLRSLFTGEKCYFGDHPKNAHHWMVISEDLFNHRSSIMENTIRKHGLPEHLLQRWMEIEDVFRKSIVKHKAFPRKVGGVELPLEGYSSITLDIGSLCDHCGTELAPGTAAFYHQRTGKLHCNACDEHVADSSE